MEKPAEITPVESTEKLLYEPLAKPSCVLAVAVDVPTVCPICGAPAELYRSQLNVMSFAPSDRVGNEIPFTFAAGVSSAPDELNVSVPVLFTGVPVASPAGNEIA